MGNWYPEEADGEAEVIRKCRRYLVAELRLWLGGDEVVMKEFWEHCNEQQLKSADHALSNVIEWLLGDG